MKTTLIVLCSALALVGCDRNRGGLGSDKNRDTGVGTSRDSTYSTPSMTDTNQSSTLTNDGGTSANQPGAIK
jgi:hypothetical protein